MSIVGKPYVPRPNWDTPVAQRIMKYARDRRDGGLPPWFDFDRISNALPDVGRDELRRTLAVLVRSVNLKADHGPQSLADRRQPDRWSA